MLIAYAPFHHNWRLTENQRLFDYAEITKDDWAVAWVFIDVEAYALGGTGLLLLLLIAWKYWRGKSNAQDC